MAQITHGDIISLLQRHHSIRKFKSEKISEETVTSIIQSAQMASTSSHVQAYSIIGVTDENKKEALAQYAGGQQYVRTCSHFFVFCADLHRLENITKKEAVDATETFQATESFIVATVDAALAAQNAAIAAEALGLGIVYIGGIRNNPDKVCELLKLPEKVYPVFGMCLGYPDQSPDVKPRLPHEVVYHQNEYDSFESDLPKIEAYDQLMKQYYIDRTDGQRSDTWSQMMAQTLSKKARLHMKSFLEKQGFPLK